MKKTSYKKHRTIHLPKVIVDNLLLKLHLGFADFDYNIEVFISIINEIINKSSIFNKKEDYLYHFTPLDSRYLKVKYGNSYPNYIRFLVNQGIIWNDNFYKGKTTYYYLYHLDYYTKDTKKLHNINKEILHYPYCFLEVINIVELPTENNEKISNQKNRICTDWCKIKILINSKNKRFLTSSYEQDSIFINNATKHVKKMGSHFRKNFKLRHNDAVTFIEDQYKFNMELAISDDDRNKATQKYISRLSSVIAIHNGKNSKTLKFSKNKTNNRIDTNLTFMASELRQFIIGYDDMVYLDLKNSQPALFNILLKDYLINATEDLKKEIEQYFNLTINGNWYEHLQELYGISRKESKDLWMKIAYSKNKSYKEDKKAFKEVYPNIYKIISSQKTKNHAEFAIKLQQIESSIFIDGICRELVNQGIVPFTVHDAVIVNKEDKKQAIEIMESVFKDILGVVPVISEE